jgi:hypothetical protein
MEQRYLKRGRTEIVHEDAPRVFLQTFSSHLLSISSLRGNFPKTLLLVSWAKIQYARDGEGPDL